MNSSYSAMMYGFSCDFRSLLPESSAYKASALAFNLLGNVPEDGPQDILLEHPKMSIHISLGEDHQVEEATVKINPAPAAEE